MTTYRTPAAFRTAVEARLRAAAKNTGRPINELRRQYLTQRFLARVYAQPNPGWILLGGTALLARIPGARHSQDVDFLHPQDLGSAAADLAALLAVTPGPDPFVFDLAMPAAHRGGDHMPLKITARLGATVVDTFPVDITRRAVIATAEVLRPDPVIVIDDVDALPPFLSVPLAQQIADKLCAMYERHGAAAIPSSRHRDLVDLMLITTYCTDLDAGAVTAAVDAEQRRRTMTIPTGLPSPSRQWATGYRNIAARAALNPQLHRLTDALDQLRAFAGPILTGTATGTWEPITKRWSDPT